MTNHTSKITPPAQGLLEDSIDGLGRACVAFRVELAILGLIAGAYYGLLRLVGPVVAGIGVAVLLGALIGTGPIRRRLVQSLKVASVKRKWVRSIKWARIPALGSRVPTIRNVGFSPGGVHFDVALTGGATADDLDKASESLAALCGVRDVCVARDADDASVAHVKIISHNVFAERIGPPWPTIAKTWVSFYEPIPIGIDESGAPATLLLPERNLLIGGEPGSGKSVAMSLIVATAAMDPQVKLYLFDAKMVELANWRHCAEAFVGPALDDALAVMAALRAEMEERYRLLLDAGLRKVERHSQIPLIVVAIDELALYLNGGDKAKCAAFAEALRDLVARGRAAGIIVVCATQKPSADTVPTSIRDLFGFRWAMRCTTKEASDTILGSGWASLGVSAADIAASERGVGVLLYEAGSPVKLRAYHLADPALSILAGRAKSYRERCEKLAAGKAVIDEAMARLDAREGE